MIIKFLTILPLIAKVWIIIIAIMIFVLWLISRRISIESGYSKKSGMFFLLDAKHKVSLSRFQLFSWSIVLISLVFSIVTVHYVETTIDMDSKAGEEVIQSSQVDKTEGKTEGKTKEATDNQKDSESSSKDINKDTNEDITEDKNTVSVFNIIIPTSFFLLIGVNLSAFGISSTFDVLNDAGTTRTSSPSETSRRSQNQKNIVNLKKSNSIKYKPHHFGEVFMEHKNGTISISRFQNFFITLVLLYQFFMQTIYSIGNLANDVIRIEGLSPTFLVLLSVSHAGYLGKKFYSKVYPSGDQTAVLPINTFSENNNNVTTDPVGSNTSNNTPVYTPAKSPTNTSPTNMHKEGDEKLEQLLKTEIDKFINLEVSGRHLNIPYAEGVDNTVSKIKSNVERFIPQLGKLSRSRLVQTLYSIKNHTGIGDVEYITQILKNTVKNNQIDVSSIKLSHEIPLSDVKTGDLIEIKDYYRIPIYLIIYSVDQNIIKYSFVCPVHGLHNGSVQIGDWNAPLNSPKQIWHDISFNSNALQKSEVNVMELGAGDEEKPSNNESKLENSQKIRNILGYDFAVKKSEKQLATLKKKNGKFVGRYYYKKDSWKQLQPSEAQLISNLGMDVLAIFESNPTSADYFSFEKGLDDCKKAVDLGKYVGQPTQSAIYFTVDYNPSDEDYPKIEKYMKAIYEHMTELGSPYKIGLYGTYEVVKHFDGKYGIEYLWQTMAWSKGKKYDNACIIQTKNDMQINNMVVDENKSTDQYGGFRVINDSKK